MSEQKTEQPLNEIKTQECQLRSKYGNIEKRSGKHLLMKKLAGKKQYFDSGDYNMQQTKTKTSKSINPLAKPVGNRGKRGFYTEVHKNSSLVPIQNAQQLTRGLSSDKTSPKPKQVTKPRLSLEKQN